MRLSMNAARFAALPLLLSLTGCGGGGGSTPPPPSGATPTPAPTPIAIAREYAPYIDVTDVPPFAMTGMASSTGHKHYTLAFFQDGGGCAPKWGGDIALGDNYYADQIDALRASGGDVIFSFGGAAGIDLAVVCGSVASLQNAYQQVVTQYHAASLDMDVEGSPLSDTPSIDRRNKALKALETANPDVRLSYTLPADPSGLTSQGLDLLRNAVQNGVRVDVVNVMAMDYGGPRSHMGQDAISAAQGAAAQIGSVGLQASLGVTVMIGQNDEAAEIFSLSDADELIAFAKANGFVGRLAMWSANRDNGGCPGLTTASSECSGVSQNAFAFSNKFKTF